jgi:hypothetical protein
LAKVCGSDGLRAALGGVVAQGGALKLGLTENVGRAFVLTTITLVSVVLWQAIFIPTLAKSWFSERTVVPIQKQVLVVGKVLNDSNGILKIAPQKGQVVIRVTLPLLRAQDNSLIDWYAHTSNANDTAAVQWKSRASVEKQPLKISGDLEAQSWNANGDTRWLGEIEDLQLVVSSDSPVFVGALVIARDSVQHRLFQMWDGWFGFRPWKLSDINFIEATDRGGQYNFELICVIATITTCLVYVIGAIWAKKRVIPQFLALILFSGWFWAAFRWEVDFAQKSIDTWKRFGGKTLHEKHLAADDHEFYWMVETIKSLLTKPNARETRIFVHYSKGRDYDVGKLVYYSAPSSLNFFDVPLPVGSIFGVINASHEFQPEARQLTLSNGTTFRAEKIAERGGAAVYRAL